MNEILQQLDSIIAQRRSEGADTSYVAQLNAAGLNKILEKVGEECVEMIIAAKDAQGSKSNDELVHETADLWFHCLVLLSYLDSSGAAVLSELAGRFDTSGLAEKAARQDPAGHK